MDVCFCHIFIRFSDRFIWDNFTFQLLSLVRYFPRKLCQNGEKPLVRHGICKKKDAHETAVRMWSSSKNVHVIYVTPSKIIKYNNESKMNGTQPIKHREMAKFNVKKKNKQQSIWKEKNEPNRIQNRTIE